MHYRFSFVLITSGILAAQGQQAQQTQQAQQAQPRAQQAQQQAQQQGQSFKLPGIAGPNIGTTSFLGVGIQEITTDRAKALKLPEEAGVEVTLVASDSPAEKAGVKVGDVIMEYNGQRVEGKDQFSRMVRETPAGRDVKLGIVRNGSQQTITAKIAQNSGLMQNGQLLLPLPNQRFNVLVPDLPRSLMTWRSGALGVEAEALDGQLADYFGVKEGVLVRSVNKGSPAEKAGIKAGDVIVKVDDAKIANPADITNHLRNQRGRNVTVLVSREHKEMTIMVTLEASDQLRPARVVGQNWAPAERPLTLPFGVVQ